MCALFQQTCARRVHALTHIRTYTEFFIIEHTLELAPSHVPCPPSYNRQCPLTARRRPFLFQSAPLLPEQPHFLQPFYAAPDTFSSLLQLSDL